jgi:hypothetical protein
LLARVLSTPLQVIAALFDPPVLALFVLEPCEASKGCADSRQHFLVHVILLKGYIAQHCAAILGYPLKSMEFFQFLFYKAPSWGYFLTISIIFICLSPTVNR